MLVGLVTSSTSGSEFAASSSRRRAKRCGTSMAAVTITYSTRGAWSAKPAERRALRRGPTPERTAPELTPVLLVVSALLGLAIGSFLNVVIYRVPAGKSVLHPPSACPQCAHPIIPRDNLPLVSWLLLRGRCRYCATHIPVRYPLVELLTAALFVVVALRFGWTWTLTPMMVFVAGLVALGFIDLDHMLLPRAVIYPVAAMVGGLLVLAAAMESSWHRLLVAGVCAVVEIAVLLAIHLASPTSMGAGDVRFVGLIGMALGWLGWWYAFFGFIAANLTGAVFGITLIALGRAGRKSKIPFGVFLALGAVLAISLAGTLHLPQRG
jgi:leader peptidase (prepilin peptidase) / N-methyltransferase